ncbi:putative oligosaccharyltransferase complex subunit epsilon [Monocercomonoides exilis]|uniref:putative oligosaccharyltransferase complex subunit epsilon n=1 Tax=Monocercomonoides exilis TaxID=2049356 RepID=UPI00355A5E5C|nr:putative oligosaccharyltransferase complex subunit epsilon [Monocercomonoides exilis]
MMSVISSTWKKYRANNAVLVQFLDLFIIFCAFMTVSVFAYGIVFSTAPYNAFISAIFACAGPLVFTVNLRMQLTDPKEFFNISPEMSFMSYLACNGLIFFIISSFLG